MAESAGEPSVRDALLADEEAVLPQSSSVTGRSPVRNWKRAAAALERETGLDVHAHRDFPQHLGGLSRKFVTKIVTVIGEQSYTWEARQHRRNRPQWQDVETKTELHGFAVFDAGRIKQALSNPVKRISFWVGPLFFLGAALFVAGAATEMNVGYWQGEWTAGQQLAYVDIPFFVGSIAFLLGCYASFIEAVNVDVSDEWDSWDESGRKDPSPPVSYAPWPTSFDSQQLGFYGLLTQYIGAIVFCVGCGTEVAHSVLPTLSPALVTWLLDFPYLIGGACFALGAFLLAAEGSHSWWRGLLPPLRLEETRSVNYWLEFLNWFGSLLFLLGGAVGWFTPHLTPEQAIVVTGITWLLGSAVFVLQGALLYLEIVNPAW